MVLAIDTKTVQCIDSERVKILHLKYSFKPEIAFKTTLLICTFFVTDMILI